MNDEYMTTREVADYLNTTTMSIWRWERAGIFPQAIQPSGKGGKYKHYKREEIEAFKAGTYKNV